jgi:hypothetical protein
MKGMSFLPGAGVGHSWTARHGSLARLYYFTRKGKSKEAIELFLKISRFSYGGYR